ncbi:cupin domain-containing protein [Actinomadura graeca]|uniref:Cupin domain-containing protein n=1 Tax=Actinomadura graeca TaxID=2750812 RepID=A0ABX8QR93_9ACTN|nr:cupin domain-containing protein [Actinomadura graeca]QXJ21153.1 cupin domain-containing protein [Actinomadura graeca]
MNIARERRSTVPAHVRDAMAAAHVVPLWESPTAHQTDRGGEQAHLWPWRELAPVLREVASVTSPEVVERRVLSLVNPKSATPEDEATTGLVSAALQLLLPGERARPHRHSMNALRFVLEASGAATVVDGKVCPMERGDLVITPAWCWHEHVSDGTGPTVWVDVLDVALHLALGTDEFQPGPVVGAPAHPADAAYAVANIAPCGGESAEAAGRTHSPVFRYPLGDVVRALENAPAAPDGSRRVRYVNPLTGGPAMSMLDCTMLQVEAGEFTVPVQSTASTVCVPIEGSGESVIGGRRVSWTANDVFTIPSRMPAAHRAVDGPARVFQVSNREVYERLGLLSESHGEPGRR